MSIVKSSTKCLKRALTSRTLAAAERRHHTINTTIPSLLTSRKTLGSAAAASPAYVRWQSNKVEPPPKQNEEKPALNAQLATTLQQSDTSDLVSEVNIATDPNGVLPDDHPALSILGNSSVVIQRQLEMMNVLIGFEQANRYIIMDGEGQTIGYIAERDHGLGRSMARQMARTHRSFTTYIFDKDQKEVLRIHRPFSYINSKIRIYDPIPRGGYENSTDLAVSQSSGHQDFVQNGQISPLKLEEMKIIGECQSRWSALRRKYNLFSYRTSGESATLKSTEEQAIESHMHQFSMIDEPLLSWDFTVKEEDGRVIGSVNRSFKGFAREIFTDTGVYVLRLDAAARTSALEHADGTEIERYEVPGLTLDQRAIMIATAVSIDFDYFSRSRGGAGGFMPMFIPMGGGAAEGGAVAGAGAAAGEAGVGIGAMEGAAGAAGNIGRGAAGVGAMEGGIAGAGTMAGYEAMQRGVYGDRNLDDASPQNAEPPPFSADSVEQSENQPGQDVWGTEQDPWSEATNNVPSEGGGGSWLDTITDWFSGD